MFGLLIPDASRMKSVTHRMIEGFLEWRYGISTRGYIGLGEFGITDSSCHHYGPTDYRYFRKLMKHVKIRGSEDVFLDLGSGKGRAVVLSATYPFRKVIGVEISSELNAIAQENVRRVLPRLRCKDVELHQVDARIFRIPPEVTVIFLNNPFSEEVLIPVFSNIRQSVQESPRRITILYLAPPGERYLDNIRDNLDWLQERKRVNLGKYLQLTIYSCGVPQADARQLWPR